MKKFFRANLKTRLFLLILLAFIPAFALSVLNSVQRLQAQQENAGADALRLVRLMSNSHRQIVASAVSFLRAVVRVGAPEQQPPARCRDSMNDLVHNFPQFITFGIALPNGDIYCSAEPARLKGNIAGLFFFRDALARHNVALGPYEFDAVLSKPVMFIGVPIIGAQQQVKAVAFAAFDLGNLNEWPATMQLATDTVLSVFDDAGLMLARQPDREKWSGTYHPALPIVQYIGNHGEEGALELRDHNDRARLFAYSVIHKTPEQTVYLSLSVPSADAYAAGYATFRDEMFSLMIACLLVLGIAWIGSEVLIIRKLRLLIAAADRIRGGQLHVRSGIKPGFDETAQLAGALDSMAAAIEKRMLALEQHGREMHQLRDMNEALQACLSRDEVYAVVRQSVQQLFPGRAGALYVTQTDMDQFQMATSWQQPASATTFEFSDCWAARRGKTYRVDVHAGADGSASIRCRHVQVPPPLSYLCVPLLVQGELMGLLHLETSGNFPLTETEPGSQVLAETAAEYAALRLTHIRLRDRLHDQAMRDGLTGLFNRRYMEEALAREIHNAERSHGVVSIIMLDIDHFKRFNDNFGHAAGDALLRELGKMLQSQMRGGDIVCRYGGEEFTVILPGTALARAQEVAEKMRRKTKRLRIQSNTIVIDEVRISLGVAAYPQHGSDGNEVLHAADLALLQAKQTRDCTVVASE